MRDMKFSRWVVGSAVFGAMAFVVTIGIPAAAAASDSPSSTDNWAPAVTNVVVVESVSTLNEAEWN